MSIRTYLKNKKQTHFTIGDIEVFVKNEIENENVSVKSVINLVVRKIPKHLLKDTIIKITPTVIIANNIYVTINLAQY